MASEFEGKVLESLEEIKEKLDEVVERQDRLDEAISNISTPGGDYSIYEER